ncbi:fused MFS/spermidine synthase [Agarilytica rhodophyticola]|uniref:fused MFS/spermidine synthase n=1 Tax=Agarilytica rhodophyticola TaxID=1737490 RepID=UPI000B348AF0|nr:fused MFS/spermidine synthase [Agarilytica rhodophyticola]
MDNSKKFVILILIFGISGFSGLIYQSIWASYLKLFLGHSAYAQTLVLSIFMGGMAIGAWYVGKRTADLKRPVLWYAITEAAVGVLGIVFHAVYMSVTSFSYEHVVSGMSSPELIGLYKWTLATLLILPQSILLGATFPLLAAGLVRAAPAKNGRLISLLYFSNSLGAVVGVLTSGFVLIQNYGLPGTVAIAGFVNLWLAALVWVINNKWEIDDIGLEKITLINTEKLSNDNAIVPSTLKLMILCAGFTGMASFFYELGWIRMLSMVLGSSTHSFELMLSGFILGIAIGGFWIKNRIETLVDPVKTLAYIQLTMGALAALSLFVYDQTFSLMSVLMRALDQSEPGYLFFNLSSHFVVLLLMLPTTICAGMTLPLITYSLMKTSVGEKSIGMVYSANTLGSILGILLVVHMILPVLGLKAVIILGAGIDIVVGFFLLRPTAISFKHPRIAAPVAGAALIVLSAVAFFELDPNKTSSSVFRNGRALSSGENIARLDGKTSSIDVYTVGKDEEERMVIATNGKPDASITVDPKGDTSPDEITMIMAAALPLAMHDNPEYVANIGIGSGLTGHTLMGDKRIKRLDSIEIESKMVEGAKFFGDKVSRSFTDERSKIHIEDAKTFFSYNNHKYDVIVSEPSNPWVSGVATLFSSEFYNHINQYIAEDGIFVQWLHLYETDLHTVASVMKALGEKFNHYNVYSSNTVDMLIVASQSQEAINVDVDIFKNYEDLELLERVGLSDLNDIKFHFLASKRVLAPFFESFDVAANSDFYPVIDTRAVKARFLKLDALEITGLYRTPFTMENLWPGNEPAMTEESSVVSSQSKHFSPSVGAMEAKQVYEYYFNQTALKQDLPDKLYFASQLFYSAETCHKNLNENYVVKNLSYMASMSLAFWNKGTNKKLVEHLDQLPCVQASELVSNMVATINYTLTDEYASLSAVTAELLETLVPKDKKVHDNLSVFLLSMNMYASFMDKNFNATIAAFDEYESVGVNMKKHRQAIAMPIIYQHAKQELIEQGGIASSD